MSQGSVTEQAQPSMVHFKCAGCKQHISFRMYSEEDLYKVSNRDTDSDIQSAVWVKAGRPKDDSNGYKLSKNRFPNPCKGLYKEIYCYNCNIYIGDCYGMTLPFKHLKEVDKQKRKDATNRELLKTFEGGSGRCKVFLKKGDKDVLQYGGEIREGNLSEHNQEAQSQVMEIKQYIKQDLGEDLPDNEWDDSMAAFYLDAHGQFTDSDKYLIQSWNKAIKEWKTCHEWYSFSQPAKSHLLCGCLLLRFTKSFAARINKEKGRNFSLRNDIKKSILGACKLVSPFGLSHLNKIHEFEFKEWLDFSDPRSQYVMDANTDGQMISSANYDPVLLHKVLETFLDRPRLEPGSTVLLLETEEFFATANAEDVANLLGKVTVPSESSISDEKINHILDFYCKGAAIYGEDDDKMKEFKEYPRSVNIQDDKYSGMLRGYVIDAETDLLADPKYSEALQHASPKKIKNLLRPLNAFLWLFHVRNENDYFKQLKEFPIWESFWREGTDPSAYDLHGFSAPLTILSATAIWNMRSSDLKIITGRGKHQQKGKDRAVVYQTLVGEHGVLHGIAEQYNGNAGCWEIKDKDKAATKLAAAIQQKFQARKNMKNKNEIEHTTESRI
jgi:hypothetical protein